MFTEFHQFNYVESFKFFSSCILALAASKRKVNISSRNAFKNEKQKPCLTVKLGSKLALICFRTLAALIYGFPSVLVISVSKALARFPFIRWLGRNCQAINNLLKESINSQAINNL